MNITQLSCVGILQNLHVIATRSATAIHLKSCWQRDRMTR